jgi:hypothetical protein
MNAEQKIRMELKNQFGEGRGNACQVWKGYDVGTNRTGWHYVPFGETARYLGKSVSEAIEKLQARNE